MNVTTQLELMTRSDCEIVCKRDSVKVSTTPDKFIRSNLLSYYLVINTWLLMFRQWSYYGWIAIRDFIMREGLFEAIRRFDESALSLIVGESIDFGLARAVLQDIIYVDPITGIRYDVERSIGRDPQATALQLFRYPKRFTPLLADKLSTASLERFTQLQKQLKVWQQRPMSTFIVERVRASVYSLIDWERLTDDLESFSIDDYEFTGGVSLECSSKLHDKLVSVQRRQPEYFVAPFGVPLVSLRDDVVTHPKDSEIRLLNLDLYDPEQENSPKWGKWFKTDVRLVRLSAVPKNYKTARIIAPELTTTQAKARRYFDIMDRYTPSGISLHDQTVQQKMASYGSYCGDWATLDLTNASDSYTWTLLDSVLPPRFSRAIKTVLPTHYTLDKGKTRYQLQSACTMGNSITFWLESVVFYAIVLAAISCCKNLGIDIPEECYVYGDDIICPTESAETVIFFLEQCGFSVNKEKSYYSKEGSYRESCGEEYRRGIRLSGVYYPRFPVRGSLTKKTFDPYTYVDTYRVRVVDSMTSVIELQHRLFGVCYPAARFLEEVVREFFPKMSSSTPEQGLSDLWSYDPQFRRAWYKTGDPDLDRKWLKVDSESSPTRRCKHYMPKTVITPPSDVDPGANKLWLAYKYTEFLKKGPRYANDLDRLLGISMPLVSFDEFVGTQSIKWVEGSEP